MVWFTDTLEGIKYIKLFENRDQTLKATTKAQRYVVNKLELYWMAENVDEDQVLIEEVPDYSYYYVKKFDENKNLIRYQSLMQVTIINNCYVFSLDEERVKEVAFIESIDLLMDIKTMLNIGVKPQYSLLDENKENRLDNYTVEMSPNGLYSFWVHQILLQ